MDGKMTLTYRTELTHGIEPVAMRPLLATGDERAHRVVLRIYRGGEAVALEGVRVSGGFLRADGSMVLLSGEVSGNAITVTLPQACYRVAGAFGLAIRMAQEQEVNTVFWGQGVVTRVDSDAIIDPDERIPSLEELLKQIERMERGTAAAEVATERAAAAAGSAEAATERANTAAQGAESATAEAQQAAHTAVTEALTAHDAAERVEQATETATAAAAAAWEATSSVIAAGQRAEQATEAAEAATERTEQAAGHAQAAASSATEATDAAWEAAAAAGRWEEVTVEVTMLEAEELPVVTVTDTETGKAISFALPRGLTGLTPEIAIGEVRTGEPGSEARAWLTGTAEAPVLNLSIPQGDVGKIENLTVCGVGPDGSGDIPLTAEDVGAVPLGATVALQGDVEAFGAFDASGDLTIDAQLTETGVAAGVYGPPEEAAEAPEDGDDEEPAAADDEGGEDSPEEGEPPEEGGDSPAVIPIPRLTIDAKGRVTGAETVPYPMPSGGVDALAIYPVGSIYMSANDASPAALFGGDWEQLKDRFLLAAGDDYEAGETGGKASVTSGGTSLTEAQLPAHKHTVNSTSSSWSMISHWSDQTAAGTNTTSSNSLTSSKYSGSGSYQWWKNTLTNTHAHTTNNSGSGQPHDHTVDIMPPYLAVYMWRRVA